MKIKSKISRVELFQKGAIIHRTISITESGSYEIWNLPHSFNEASIRFSGIGVHIQKHSVRLDIVNLPEKISNQEKDTYAEAQEIRSVLNSQSNELKKDLRFWKSRSIPEQPKDRDGVPISSNVELLLAALKLQQERISTLKEAIQKQEQAIHTQEEIIQQIEWKIDEYEKQKSKPNICKTLVFEAIGCGTLHVQYFFQNAAWYPSYTLQLNADYTHSNLIVSAEIWQESGEDWNEVDLSLSTANIDTMTELPQLNSRRIGRKEERKSPLWIPPPVGTDKLFADYDTRILLFSKSNKQESSVPQKHKKGGTSRLPPPSPSMPPKSQDIERGAALPASLSPPAEQETENTDFFTRSAPKRRGRKVPTNKRAKKKPTPKMRKVVSEDLFDFQKIRLVEPNHPSRGNLTPQSQHTLLCHDLSTRYAWAINIQPKNPTEPTTNESLRKPSVHNFFAYVYRATGKKNLPSNNRFRKIILMEKSIVNELVYVSVPSRSQQVFRQIRLKNPLSAPLLSGPVEVYHNKKFLLESSFEDIPSHGSFQFDLGVEANIRVSRNMTSKESIEGMFVKEKNIHNNIHFSIRNLLSTPIKIELMEVLPSVLENESLIQIKEIQPRPTCNLQLPKTEPEGARGWSVDIAPQETKEISCSYTINIPTTKELVGGNRRGES